jgi:8-oxo-dGTP pyrophosphatase MutT (NUDIX family)
MKKKEQLLGKLSVVPGVRLPESAVKTAVLVLLFFSQGEYHFIFQKRAAGIRQNGEIGFPGGLCQPQDESSMQTALRETAEEMGLPANKIQLLGALDTILAPIGALVDAYVGIADIMSLRELHPNIDEVADVFSVPVSFFEAHEPKRYDALLKVHPVWKDEESGQDIVLFPAQQLGLPERYTKPWGGLKHTIYVYEVGNEKIWGITARFIRDIVEILRSENEM